MGRFLILAHHFPLKLKANQKDFIMINPSLNFRTWFPFCQQVSIKGPRDLVIQKKGPMSKTNLEMSSLYRLFLIFFFFKEDGLSTHLSSDLISLILIAGFSINSKIFQRSRYWVLLSLSVNGKLSMLHGTCRTGNLLWLRQHCPLFNKICQSGLTIMTSRKMSQQLEKKRRKKGERNWRLLQHLSTTWIMNIWGQRHLGPLDTSSRSLSP